jgi:hypothetical protein
MLSLTEPFHALVAPPFHRRHFYGHVDRQSLVLLRDSDSGCKGISLLHGESFRRNWTKPSSRSLRLQGQ